MSDIPNQAATKKKAKKRRKGKGSKGSCGTSSVDDGTAGNPLNKLPEVFISYWYSSIPVCLLVCYLISVASFFNFYSSHPFIDGGVVG